MSAQMLTKPGRRVYTSIDDLPPVKNGLGISILSTPKGVMTDKAAHAIGQQAGSPPAEFPLQPGDQRKGTGGEYLVVAVTRRTGDLDAVVFWHSRSSRAGASAAECAAAAVPATVGVSQRGLAR